MSRSMALPEARILPATKDTAGTAVDVSGDIIESCGNVDLCVAVAEMKAVDKPIDHRFVDGGLTANNPTLQALTLAGRWQGQSPVARQP